MMEIIAKCPKKKCKGWAEASVSGTEGNTEGPCDECGAQVGFHYCIEIDSVYIVTEDGE